LLLLDYQRLHELARGSQRRLGYAGPKILDVSDFNVSG
jgi:hypothetical protein